MIRYHYYSNESMVDFNSLSKYYLCLIYTTGVGVDTTIIYTDIVATELLIKLHSILFLPISSYIIFDFKLYRFYRINTNNSDPQKRIYLWFNDFSNSVKKKNLVLLFIHSLIFKNIFISLNRKVLSSDFGSEACE